MLPYYSSRMIPFISLSLRRVKETKPLNLNRETNTKSAGCPIQTPRSFVRVLSDSARQHVSSSNEDESVYNNIPDF